MSVTAVFVLLSLVAPARGLSSRHAVLRSDERGALEVEESEEASLEAAWVRCKGELQRCWKPNAARWRRTAECSGAPAACQQRFCGTSERPSPVQCGSGDESCAALEGFCAQMQLRKRRGCRDLSALRTLRSGDTVFLRTSTGTCVDVFNGSVHARWDDNGQWQVLTIEKAGDGDLRAGDRARLRAHDGSWLRASSAALIADKEADSEEHYFVLGFRSGGPLVSGEPTTFTSRSGMYLVAKGGDSPLSLADAPGPSAEFRMEKELELADSDAANYGGRCNAEAASRPVAAGDTVYLRSYFQNFIGVREDAVDDSFPDQQPSALLRLEKAGGSYIQSNDTVTILGANHRMVALQDGAGVARPSAGASDHGADGHWRIQKLGGGEIHFGDRVRFQAHDGTYLDVQNQTVQARWHDDPGNQTVLNRQTFLIEDPESEEEPLQFLHIPKTGGTAVEDAAHIRRIHWGRHAFYDRIKMPGTEQLCSAHHVPPRYVPERMRMRYLASEVFCIVRHPYERAVSEYVYQYAAATERQNDPAAASLLQQPCTAESLNRFLQDGLSKALNSHEKFVHDCHFLPQVEYVWERDRQWCADVLKMEELPGAFDSLMERKGYSVRLLPEVHNGRGERCPGLSAHDLSNKTKHLLNRVYAADFRRLGYEPEEL